MCWVQLILLNYWNKSSLSLLNLLKCYFKVSKNYHFLSTYYKKCQKTTCSKYLKLSYFHGFNGYNIYMFASTSISTHWALKFDQKYERKCPKCRRQNTVLSEGTILSPTYWTFSSLSFGQFNCPMGGK